MELAKIQLEDMPVNLNVETGLADLFETNETGLLPSLTTVLIQESQRFNNLLNVMRKSLKDLIDAIQGLVTMSSTLDSMY
jgi:dynein heavy chain